MSESRKQTLGVAIVTRNEAHMIEKCIASVKWADEIIVVDTVSTDNTAEVARRAGARVIVKEDPGIRHQKQFALEQVTCDWILLLDPDEWLSEECQSEIQNLLKTPQSMNGFQIPRYHVFMGRILKHGKGVDHPLRLLRRGTGAYIDRLPHEYVIVQGETSTLKTGMIHESTPTVDNRVWKIQKETNLEMANRPDRPPTVKEMFLNPVIFFLSMLIKKGAWRDGMPGVILVGLFSCQLFIMHAKFYEAYYDEHHRG